MSHFDFDPDDSMRIQSPRPETPEPDTRQGRRNWETGVQLLDDEGAISEKVNHFFTRQTEISFGVRSAGALLTPVESFNAPSTNSPSKYTGIVPFRGGH